MDANFLSTAPGEIDEFFGRGQAVGMFEQASESAAEGRARDDGTAEGILDDGIIGAADFEGAFAGPNVQAGFAMQDGVED